MKPLYAMTFGALLLCGCTAPAPVQTAQRSDVCEADGQVFSVGATHGGLRCDWDALATNRAQHNPGMPKPAPQWWKEPHEMGSLGN